jgi:hypothetical protein
MPTTHVDITTSESDVIKTGSAETKTKTETDCTETEAETKTGRAETKTETKTDMPVLPLRRKYHSDRLTASILEIAIPGS